MSFFFFQAEDGIRDSSVTGVQTCALPISPMIRLPKWLLLVLTLALFVAVAAPVLADEAKGKIKSVNTDKKELVVTDKDAKDWTFVFNNDGKVRVGDKDGTLTDLKEGDEGTITYEKKDDKLMASKIERK